MPTVVKVRALGVCVNPVGLTMGSPARVRDTHMTLELHAEVEIVLTCITHNIALSHCKLTTYKFNRSMNTTQLFNGLLYPANKRARSRKEAI
jgi:hypothetical protein